MLLSGRSVKGVDITTVEAVLHCEYTRYKDEDKCL